MIPGLDISGGSGGFSGSSSASNKGGDIQNSGINYSGGLKLNTEKLLIVGGVAVLVTAMVVFGGKRKSKK